jgi:hypothetical protein
MFMKRISIALCLLVVACGDATNSETAPEPVAYEDMNFEQREAFMVDVVLPQMKETFVAFDAKFETMDCSTCHGDGVADGSYAMPNAKIVPLPGTEEEFFEAVKDPEYARWAEFMMGKVWPQMTNLLKVTAYDPNTAPEGFSCSNCHTHTAPAGAP